MEGSPTNMELNNGTNGACVGPYDFGDAKAGGWSRAAAYTVIPATVPRGVLSGESE